MPKSKLRPSSLLKHLFPRTDSDSPNSHSHHNGSTGSAESNVCVGASCGSSGAPKSDLASDTTYGPFMVPECATMDCRKSLNISTNDESSPSSECSTPPSSPTEKNHRHRQKGRAAASKKPDEESPFKVMTQRRGQNLDQFSPTSVFEWASTSSKSLPLRPAPSTFSEELSIFHDCAGTPRAPFAKCKWPSSSSSSPPAAKPQFGHVSKSFDEEFFSDEETYSTSTPEWWYSPASSKPGLQGGFDEEFFSFRSSPGQNKGHGGGDAASSGDSSGSGMNPPNIQRVTNTKPGILRNKKNNDSDIFPLSSWEGVIADDVFLHYDVENNSDLWDSGIDNNESFCTANGIKDTANEENKSCGDDETVVISNKREVPSPVSRDLSGNNNIGLAKGTNHENMKKIFNVTLSAPISLPKEKKKFSIKRLIVSRSARDFGTVPGVGMSMGTNVAVALSTTTPQGLEREKRSPWKKFSKVSEKVVLRDAQENILTGTPLGSQRKPTYAMQRTRSLTDRRDKTRSRLHPAEKLENMMKKKVHRRNPSEQMTKIRAIMKRDTELLTCGKDNGKKWNHVDDAIRGRFDGIDVISCGCASKNIRTRHGERKAPGKRYTPRDMIIDTLWRSSGCDPPEIVFEGYTQRGCGSDRWSAPVHKSNNDPTIPSHLWGQNNMAPPTCPSELVEVEDDEGNIRLVHSPYRNETSRNILTVQTLDQLKLAHEYAIAPLKKGNIFKSVQIFEKILANLKVKFEACEAKNHVVGSTYHNIALLHMWGGRFEEALTFMNQAITVRAHTLGHNHASVAVSLARQGMIYFALERFDSALRATNQALAIRKMLNDQDHMEVSKLINNVGVIRFLQGEKKNSVKDLTQALQMQRKWVEGSLHRGCVLFDTAVTLSNMGKIYVEREKYEMAAYLYEEALQLQTAVFTRDHDAVLVNLGNVAFSKALAGEKTNAIRIYKSRHNIQSQKYGPQSREAVATKGLMSVLYIQQSNYVNSLRCLEDVLRWQENNLDADHPALLNTKVTMERLNRLKGM